MKYLLMINVAGGPYQHNRWPKEDFAANLEFMRRFARKLRASGELVGAEALRAPDQARRVRATEAGAVITDGVFPESKEFLAGFWVVEVASPERAYELAAEGSSVPGPGGVPLCLPIEVREVISAQPGAPMAR